MMISKVKLHGTIEYKEEHGSVLTRFAVAINFELFFCKACLDLSTNIKKKITVKIDFRDFLLKISPFNLQNYVKSFQ